MKMTPAFLIIGALMIFWSSVFVAVLLPAITMPNEVKSDIWREWTVQEAAGHKLYNDNGCSYCHSQFVRTVDWDSPGERVAQMGDYAGKNALILGVERTGPDLSQNGGLHPDDWQTAHFINPRFTRPMSLMPSWEFLGPDRIAKLTAYIQSTGMKQADERVAQQKEWKAKALAAYKSGPDGNIAWIHDHVPENWRYMANPYPATTGALDKGKVVYQQYCINCHGPVGDGQGLAAPHLDPPPLNFTTLKRNLAGGKYIGGIFYYQIMNGITGTAMPYFKHELESEKIWDVSNYVAVDFVGYTDATMEPRGIPAAYETPWTNPYASPATQPAATTTQPTGQPAQAATQPAGGKP